MTIDTKLGKGDTLFIPDAEAEIKVAAKPVTNNFFIIVYFFTKCELLKRYFQL